MRPSARDNTAVRVAALTLCLLLLTACGQKGDLYLPEPSDGAAGQTEDGQD